MTPKPLTPEEEAELRAEDECPSCREYAVPDAIPRLLATLDAERSSRAEAIAQERERLAAARESLKSYLNDRFGYRGPDDGSHPDDFDDDADAILALLQGADR